jgi:hypothetical protein
LALFQCDGGFLPLCEGQMGMEVNLVIVDDDNVIADKLDIGKTNIIKLPVRYLNSPNKYISVPNQS